MAKVYTTADHSPGLAEPHVGEHILIVVVTRFNSFAREGLHTVFIVAAGLYGVILEGITIAVATYKVDGKELVVAASITARQFKGAVASAYLCCLPCQAHYIVVCTLGGGQFGHGGTSEQSGGDDIALKLVIATIEFQHYFIVV